jgi:hypothetical protein
LSVGNIFISISNWQPDSGNFTTRKSKKGDRMKTGMLWYDNNPKSTLEEKIIRAVEYYKKQYGDTPTLCYVSTEAGLKSSEEVLGGLTVRINKTLHPKHIWIGFKE